MTGSLAGLFIGVLFAIFFYRAADYERIHPAAWAATSLGLSCYVALNGHGLGLQCFLQVTLFAAMWAFNIWRGHRSRGAG